MGSVAKCRNKLYTGPSARNVTVTRLRFCVSVYCSVRATVQWCAGCTESYSARHCLHNRYTRSPSLHYSVHLQTHCSDLRTCTFTGTHSWMLGCVQQQCAGKANCGPPTGTVWVCWKRLFSGSPVPCYNMQDSASESRNATVWDSINLLHRDPAVLVQTARQVGLYHFARASAGGLCVLIPVQTFSYCSGGTAVETGGQWEAFYHPAVVQGTRERWGKNQASNRGINQPNSFLYTKTYSCPLT